MHERIPPKTLVSSQNEYPKIGDTKVFDDGDPIIDEKGFAYRPMYRWNGK